MDQLGRDDRRALLILGPRQVGKTVLLYQTLDDLLEGGWPAASLAYFDFSDARITRPLFGHEVIEALPPSARDRPRVLLLDEISQAINWDRWLKQAVDGGGLRIVATDSAASALAHGGRESGLGRWDEHRLEGLTFPEFAALHLGRAPDSELLLAMASTLVERYLSIGGFPEHARNDDVPVVRARLREEISSKAIERDLARFGLEVDRVRALFTYLVASSGSIWNLQDRADDLQADRRTVAEWLRRLEDTALLVPLEQSTGAKPSSRLRAKPKIYAADHGLVSAFVASTHRTDDLRPKLFETVVFRHLREVFRDPLDRITYFRQGEQLELDFVVESQGRAIGIEVTSTSVVKPRRRDQLMKIERLLGLNEVVLIYGGVAAEDASLAGKETLRSLSLSAFLANPQRLKEGARLD